MPKIRLPLKTTAPTQTPRWFMLGVAAVLVLRIALWSFKGLTVDMVAWQAWIGRLFIEKPWHFYTETTWTHYTPGSLLFLWAYGLIFHGLFGVAFYTPFFEIVIKLFSTGFDIATAWLIFAIVKKYAAVTWAYLASFLYLVNPGVMFNTSVWGQFDGLLTFFLVLAFYLLYEKKKLVLATLMLSLCLLIKPQAIAFFPVFSIVALSLFPVKRIIRAGIVAAILFFAVGTLFFPTVPIIGMTSLYAKMAADYPYTSLNAFNLWAILGWWESDTTTVFGLTRQTWGALLYGVSVLAIAVPLLPTLVKSKKLLSLPPTIVYTALSLSALVLFIFPTRMHERYLLPVFAFFISMACLKRSVPLLVLYLATATVHLANLWYVYYTFNFLDNHIEANHNLIFQFIHEQYKLLSLLTCIVAIALYFFYYRLLYAKHR